MTLHKIRTMVGCSVSIWLTYFLVLFSLPIQSNSSWRESVIEGRLHINSAFTRGIAQWYRIYVGDLELVCSPTGYNHCDLTSARLMANESVTATFFDQDVTLLQRVRLIVELKMGEQTLISRHQQNVIFQKYNDGICISNMRKLLICVALNVVLVAITFLYKSESKEIK